MNIAKALKTKNRLSGELARAKTIFARENSHRIGEARKSDPKTLLAEVDRTQEDLVKIKTAIALASAPISEKLVRMGELKSRMAWINDLTIIEGAHKDRFSSEKTETEMWEAHIGKVERDAEVGTIQKTINDLQDEIDDFNATTKV